MTWFQLGFQNFIAKKSYNDDSCDIFVSDCMRIWHKSLSNNELLLISEKLNPLFEVPVQKLKNMTLSLLEDVKARKEIKEENNEILLKLESNILNIKFQFHVLLNAGDKIMFYREFTVPMLSVLIKTQSREKKLVEIIKDKDAEIKYYKQEYGINSNYLTTKPFSKKEFYSNESDILYDDSFLDCISSKLNDFEAGFKSKLESKPLKEILEKTDFVNKSKKTDSTLKDKILNQGTGSKGCVLLDNKVIKKIKKHNNDFKIKF